MLGPLEKKLDSWPKIAPKDGEALREFSDLLCHVSGAMVSIPSLNVLNDCIENEKLIEKVPDWLRVKWAHIVAKTQRKEDRYPSFQEFSEFVKEEADVMALPISQVFSQREKANKPARVARSYLANTSEKKTECLHCARPVIHGCSFEMVEPLSGTHDF